MSGETATGLVRPHDVVTSQSAVPADASHEPERRRGAVAGLPGAIGGEWRRCHSPVHLRSRSKLPSSEPRTALRRLSQHPPLLSVSSSSIASKASSAARRACTAHKHLPTSRYRRRAAYKPDGRRQDDWVYLRHAELHHLECGAGHTRAQRRSEVGSDAG